MSGKESRVQIEAWVLPETAATIRRIAVLLLQEPGEVIDRLVDLLPTGFRQQPLDRELKMELAAVLDIHDFEDRREP